VTDRPRKQTPRAVDAADVLGRTPPHNADAETAILAAILAGGIAALDKIRAIVSRDHFYADANARVFEAACAVADASHPVDVQTVAAWLTDRGWIVPVGGIAYLARLLDSPAFQHPERYAAIVREKARIRSLINVCLLTASEAAGDYGEAQEFLDLVEQRIFEIARDEADARRAKPIRDLARAAYRDLTSAAERPRVRGIATGLRALDRMLGGTKRGQQIIVAARPSIGKTALGLNIALNAAGTTVEGYVIGAVVFSLEMPDEEVGPRFLCGEARVDSRQVVAGKATETDLVRLVAAAHSIDGLPLWVLDREDVSVADMRAEIRRLKASWECAPTFAEDGVTLLRPGRRIGLVVIDYLQLVRPSESKLERHREQEVSGISRDLKKMARAFGLTCVTLCQLNRAVEARQDRRPNIGDLRESGAIEQDADIILLLYRAHFYLQDKTTEEAEKVKRLAEIIIGKQRNGPTGTVLVHYIEEHTLFCDAA
jgi:replicative DNA helicase